MFIGGLQKLTLLDYPGKVACTVFTAGCNFRCPFCHNSTLVYRNDDLDYQTSDDIIEFLKKRQGVLDGVCITGGEPLLHRETADLIEKIKNCGYNVKLDTNGSYPDRLIELVTNGLVDMVAVDIKNSKQKYGITIGIPDFDISPVEKTVDFLLNSDIKYEFRTTVTADFHTADDMAEIGNWIKGSKAYFLQNFVDSGELIDESVKGCTPETMHAYLDIIRKFVPNAQLRGVE